MSRLVYRSADNVKSDGESRIITGEAIVFDSFSRDLGGFKEIIRSQSITKDLIDNSDIIMNINHDDNKMVARWHYGKGTLALDLRSDGLYFSFAAPTTVLGDELLYNVRNGNLFECSFAFTLPDSDDCENWYYDDDRQLCREILDIDGLYDCSIVTTAAYGDTSCATRKYRDMNGEKIDIDEIKAKLLDERLEEVRKQIH